jgi:hypothetical protein
MVTGAVEVGVAVAGTGVEVAVGGTGVDVAVGAPGTGVAVEVAAGVWVGGMTSVEVGAGVLVTDGIGAGVSLAGAVGVAVSSGRTVNVAVGVDVSTGTEVGVSGGDRGVRRMNTMIPNAVTQTPTTTKANTPTINHWESFSSFILRLPLHVRFLCRKRIASQRRHDPLGLRSLADYSICLILLCTRRLFQARGSIRQMSYARLCWLCI